MELVSDFAPHQNSISIPFRFGVLETKTIPHGHGSLQLAKHMVFLLSLIPGSSLVGLIPSLTNPNFSLFIYCISYFVDTQLDCLFVGLTRGASGR